jgi:hypothetical protein
MTTSVVSGIFAKYTISKQVLMMFSFESFGVTIDIIPSKGLIDAVGAGNIRFDESRNLTVSNLLMHPGNDFKDALNFQIRGKPTADAELKVEVTVFSRTVPVDVDYWQVEKVAVEEIAAESAEG